MPRSRPSDLSPYNLLVCHERLVMIDLPQVVDVIAHRNRRGFLDRGFLDRDASATLPSLTLNDQG